MALRCCEVEPLVGLDVVLRDTLAVPIHNTQIVLGIIETLICSEPIQPDSFDMILRNASAMCVHETQVVLGVSETLICGSAWKRDPVSGVIGVE